MAAPRLGPGWGTRSERGLSLAKAALSGDSRCLRDGHLGDTPCVPGPCPWEPKSRARHSPTLVRQSGPGEMDPHPSIWTWAVGKARPPWVSCRP